jgi:RNase P subunit RPR2
MEVSALLLDFRAVGNMSAREVFRDRDAGGVDSETVLSAIEFRATNEVNWMEGLAGKTDDNARRAIARGSCPKCSGRLDAMERGGSITALRCVRCQTVHRLPPRKETLGAGS